MNSHPDDPTAAGWSLLYVADPLCSWCYGFAPSLAAVRARWPGLTINTMLGGLRVEGEPLDARLRGLLQHHWDEVGRRSGQPFVPDALQREGWRYTTEPACRAVVTVRELAHAEDAASAPARALAMFHAIQTAFYAQGHDATDAELLADVAQGQGTDRARFSAAFAGAEMRGQAQDDFGAAQRLGIRGFPALLAVRAGQAQMVAAGWLAPAELVVRLEAQFKP